MEISFRQHLKDRERLIGTVVTLGIPETVEVLSRAGFDWLFLDAEHSPLDTLVLQRLLMGAGCHLSGYTDPVVVGKQLSALSARCSTCSRQAAPLIGGQVHHLS